MSARDFPVGFLWGAATAAHQVEGGNTNSDWWHFEHAPHSAARESSGDGIDHWHRYAEDLALLAELGHTAHRMSVEWARIEPAPGEFSTAALGHYRGVLTELRRQGMTSFVTLHHFTLPLWFAASGGWLAPDALERFERYTRTVLDALGDLIDFVCTINEPQMVALHGYLEGYHPPGVTNPTLWRRVGRVLLDAHHVAVRTTRQHSDASPGLAVQLPVLAPARDDDVTWAFYREMRAEIIDLYLDGLRAPEGGDWLGVQYYRKNWVDPAIPTLFASPPEDVRTTQMGWAVHPEGLYEMLHRAAATGLPLYVTENGIATEDDDERIDYLESHLSAVARAIGDGIDVRGYLHWSAFDNFEWSEGYGPKFGLIAVDRLDAFRRVPKPSALAFARVGRSGRIDELRSSAVHVAGMRGGAMTADVGGSALGQVAAGFEPVREMFDDYLRRDPEFSAQLCIQLGGERVVDLVGGALEADSLTGVYSVTKGVAALVIARLFDAGLLDPDLPVVHYWPEFGAEGKREISVRQLLSHQAGVPAIDGRFRLEEVVDSAAGAERLAAQRPFWRPGSTFGYHALTIGLLMEELVRRVTGTSLQDVFERDIRSPRDADFYLGLPEALDARYVPIEDARLTAEQTREIEARPPRDALAELVFSNVDVPDDLGGDGLSTNNAAVRGSGPAAIGGVGSARGLAALYADALPSSVTAIARRPAFRAMSQQHSWGVDRVLGVANSFGMVFMLPQPRMPYGSVQAFGHDGAGGALAFADPGSGIAFGYIPIPMQYPGGADHRAVAFARKVQEITATLR